MVSLIVAMVVLVLTLSWSAGGTTVYAASMDPDSITTFDGDNSEGGVTRAAEDSTNGLTISYNNDGGEDAFGIDNFITGTIDTDHADFLYKNYHCITFSAYRNWNADRTT